jgi:hypothetical protein
MMMHKSHDWDCMEILLTSATIADRVRYILEATEGERYAIVAFIGARPLKWITNPQGLHVYCWPAAGGTHPDGIDALVKNGANVAFVERLHSKVYHSDRGTIIGSANLSANALGGVLTETAVYLPPRVFPIKQQLDKLIDGLCEVGTKEFAERLAQLRRDHNTYHQRNPASGKPTPQSVDVGTLIEAQTGPVQSFIEWYRSPNRTDWQLGVWLYQAQVPDDVEKQQLDATGKEPANWIGEELANKFTLGLPTLECRFFQKAYRIRKDGMRWWIPEVMRETKHEDWVENPYIFLAQVNVPAAVNVPFDIDDLRFRQALSNAVHQLGEKSEQMIGAVTDEFIETLARHYFAMP